MLRAQARSHNRSPVNTIFVDPRFQCGSEPAREGARPVKTARQKNTSIQPRHLLARRNQTSLTVSRDLSVVLDRPSSVLAVTLCANPLQASSHKCYRSAHRLRGRALAASDGTSKWRVPRSRIDASRGRFQELLNGRPISGTAIALS